ncbi:hypothetical protein QBC43DRAFT_132730 [Cladorrhinum sp. PSN259]|nr:hypothetical protein QBC43DRAFT_132730 [Cladorrhinum sp. PSN259]
MRRRGFFVTCPTTTTLFRFGSLPSFSFFLSLLFVDFSFGGLDGYGRIFITLKIQKLLACTKSVKLAGLLGKS